MRYILFVLLGLLFLTGCAPKEVNLMTINPLIKPLPHQTIATYEPERDLILFYEFSLENSVLVERTWGKMLPFRVEFMDLWVTGLGHDIKRLTNNHAETIKDALMWAAHKEGMNALHVSQKDYIIDRQFAHDMVDAIEAYEEKMKRYDKDRRFPLMPLPLL